MSTTEADLSVHNSSPSIAACDNASCDRAQSAIAAAASSSSSLKRPSSPDVGERRDSKKRKWEGMNGLAVEEVAGPAIDGHALAEDLAQELQCGCCSELVYKPVVVIPCDHFFCGSCCMLWVKNGGTNCPACRSVSTAVVPSRALQSVVDVLLRAAPHRQRTERERIQADEIYPTLRAFRIPTPREPSPEPVIPASSDFVQPCPHCLANNPFRWTCPRPISDPTADPNNAWRIDAGPPPGHGFCGNCEIILALLAPSTSRCDFCQVSFCGINIQGRCAALALAVQSPHGMTDVGDLIQSPEIYDCFEGHTIEVELMLDYMTAQRLTPKQIYRQIAAHIQSQPEGFRPLIEQDLFMDMHSVAGGTDPEPNAERRFICRMCATEVFLFGLRDWWIRERRKAVREGILEERQDCLEGGSCSNLNDAAHAKEFNHILSHSAVAREPEASGSSFDAFSSSSIENHDIPSPVTSSLFLPPISSDDSPVPQSSLPGMVSEMALPRSIRPSAISSHSNLRPEGTQPRGTTTSAVEIFDGAADPVDVHEVDLFPLPHTDTDVDLGGPSSSQSQRSVEAHLTQDLLAQYDSDTCSEAEVQEPTDSPTDSRLEEPAPSAASHMERRFPSMRRSQSPLKSNVDIDVASMDDIRPGSSTMFASFRIISDIGPDSAEINGHPGPSAFPVQVE